MTPSGAANAHVCYRLREPRELAEAIEPARRDAAAGALVAREVEIAVGAWQGRATSLDGRIGLLMLEGVLVALDDAPEGTV